MSGILTTAAATYAAQTLRGTTKVDIVARADAEVADWCTADWANDVDEDLVDVNKWFVGTSSAGIAGNTTTLLGALSVAEGLKAGGAALGKADVELLSTGGTIAVSDVETDATEKNSVWATLNYTNAEELVAWATMQNDASNNFLDLGGGNASYNAITQLAVYTAANATTTTGSLRALWSSAGLFVQYEDADFRKDVDLNSASPQLYMGNGAGAPNIALDRDGATSSQIAFIHDGAAASSAKRIRHESGGGLYVDNYNGASYDNLQSWTSTLSAFTTNVTLNSASPTFTVGDGTGTPAVVVDAANANQAQVWWSAAGNARWIAAKKGTSDDWGLDRYTGASVFQDTPIVVSSSDGGVTMGASGGKIGFFGTTPVVISSAYTPTNVTTDRSWDCNSTTLAELADVVATLVQDLQAYGLIA